MNEQTIQLIERQLSGLLTDDEFQRAQIVAARAALLRSWDRELDSLSLVFGLYVGTSGEMPETLPLGALGLINTLALAKFEELSPDPEPLEP